MERLKPWQIALDWVVLGGTLVVAGVFIAILIAVLVRGVVS